MKLVRDPRLPPDLRIICVDPRWCLNKQGADAVASDMQTFMDMVRKAEPPPRMPFDPDLPPLNKRAKRPPPYTHTHTPDFDPRSRSCCS